MAHAQEQVPNSSPVTPVAPNVPAVVYTEPTLRSQTGKQVLEINTRAALSDIRDAAALYGLKGLVGVLEDRGALTPIDESKPFKPVLFKGQGAVAVRRVLEDGSAQQANPRLETAEPQLNPKLAARIAGYDKTADPRLTGDTALSAEMAEMVEEYCKAEAAPIDHGAGWSDEAYAAMRQTDPGTQLRQGPLVHL